MKRKKCKNAASGFKGITLTFSMKTCASHDKRQKKQKNKNNKKKTKKNAFLPKTPRVKVRARPSGNSLFRIFSVFFPIWNAFLFHPSRHLFFYFLWFCGLVNGCVDPFTLSYLYIGGVSGVLLRVAYFCCFLSFFLIFWRCFLLRFFDVFAPFYPIYCVFLALPSGPL